MSKNYILTSHFFLPTQVRILTHFFEKNEKSFKSLFLSAGYKIANNVPNLKQSGSLLLSGQDIVYHSIFQGLFCSHPVVPVGVSEDLVKSLSGAFGNNPT